MTLRITLSEDESMVPGSPIVTAEDRCAAPEWSVPVFADWEDNRTPALLLYLSEEPEIGLRFRYTGEEWEIIDYRDGWIARLLVE
jgi:hypothetical protein